MKHNKEGRRKIRAWHWATVCDVFGGILLAIGILVLVLALTGVTAALNGIIILASGIPIILMAVHLETIGNIQSDTEDCRDLLEYIVEKMVDDKKEENLDWDPERMYDAEDKPEE